MSHPQHQALLRMDIVKLFERRDSLGDSHMHFRLKKTFLLKIYRFLCHICKMRTLSFLSVGHCSDKVAVIPPPPPPPTSTWESQMTPTQPEKEDLVSPPPLPSPLHSTTRPDYPANNQQHLDLYSQVVRVANIHLHSL